MTVTSATTMTKRLYYDQPELLEFDAVVEDATGVSGDGSGAGSLPAIILRETAFYPTSGGQVHDTGWLTITANDQDGQRLRVSEVADTEDGRIVHYLEAPLKMPAKGTAVHGIIDRERRQDHMQQ